MDNIRKIIDSWNLGIGTDMFIFVVLLLIGIILTIIVLFLAIKIDEKILSKKTKKRKIRKK